jgi:glycosyltransferase involved in cell wall biosynthesis
LRVAMMVRGYLPVPRPSDIVYAPIDLAASLADGLSERGHIVDFYGPTGNELDEANLISDNLRPLVTNNEEFQSLLGTANESMNHYIPSLWDSYLAEEMFRRAQRGEYDILHFHHPEIALSLARRFRSVPVLYTLHDPVYPWYKEVFELYDSPNQHFVSISNNQRRDAPDLNYTSTVYNGISTEDFSFSAEHEDYLLYIGRIVPEKGLKEAIQVAEATGHRLIIVGPVPPRAQGYFDQYVKPYLNEKILYLGYIERENVLPYYQNAAALLSPLQWEEPFGLTAIEAMACGTPTIAISRGSMPEIIEDGKTGYIVASVGEMIDAVGRINKIDRRTCRDHVKANFSTKHMVDGYEKAYRQVLVGTNPVRRLKRKVSGKLQQSLNLTTQAVRPKRKTNQQHKKNDREK